MKVEDEELLVRLATRGTDRLFATERAALTDALEELRALRAVADAADKFAIAYNAGPAWGEYDSLCAALKAAGR